MNGNKIIKVKEFVKKRKNTIIGASLLTIGAAIGWYGHRKRIGSLAGALDRCNKGSNHCYEFSNPIEPVPVKWLSNLGDYLIESDKNFDSGSVTEDTKVTGVMVFMKKD